MESLIYYMYVYGIIVGIIIMMMIAQCPSPPPMGCSSVAIRGRKSPLGQSSFFQACSNHNNLYISINPE
jgi:hypothetical protein